MFPEQANDPTVLQRSIDGVREDTQHLLIEPGVEVVETATDDVLINAFNERLRAAMATRANNRILPGQYPQRKSGQATRGEGRRITAKGNNICEHLKNLLFFWKRLSLRDDDMKKRPCRRRRPCRSGRRRSDGDDGQNGKDGDAGKDVFSCHRR